MLELLLRQAIQRGRIDTRDAALLQHLLQRLRAATQAVGELRRLHVHDGVLAQGDTKNGDRRAVPMHPRIRCCLQYLPITTAKITLQAAWRRARARVDMPDVHFHDLRHSAANEMVNAGVDLYTVGVVLGHRDPRSTQRYAPLTAGTLADAVGKIGKKSPHKPTKKAAGAKAK